MIDTKKKILDSAQRLIGSQGYAATSVRHIISEAGVNLAAIHYHFGSKEDLLAAVIARKADLVNEERMNLLDRLEAEAGTGPLSVKKVLEAWFLPMAEAADGDPSFVLLMGRLMSEGMLQTIVEKHFREPAERITGALRRALPELPDEEFRWRMHFMFGAMAFTMCGAKRIYRDRRGHARFWRANRPVDHVSDRWISGAGFVRRKERRKAMKCAWIVTLAAAAAMAADPPARPVLSLSLKRAVEIATSPEGNANIQLAAEALKQAQARTLESRAALLPDVESSVNYQSRTENLAAMGIKFNIPPGFPFEIPTFVGPFSTLDARVTASQTIFDFSSIRRFQAARTGAAAARSDAENAGEQVAAQVARAYLMAIKADADVDTAQSNVKLSQALLVQASNEKTAGTGTGIEITRAKVQLANDRQHLLEAQNARRSAHLRLLRAMGASLDTELELTDKLGYLPVDAVTLEQAKAQALATRPDYQAQQEPRTERAAFGQRDQTGAAALGGGVRRLRLHRQRAGQFAAHADDRHFGAGAALRRRQAGCAPRGIGVAIPRGAGAHQRFEGADRAGRAAGAGRAAIGRRRSEGGEGGLELSQNELAQARRRYEAGVATSIEVTDAQTRLERARDNQTTALYNYNVARIDLAQAMGKVRSTVQ